MNADAPLPSPACPGPQQGPGLLLEFLCGALIWPLVPTGRSHRPLSEFSHLIQGREALSPAVWT